MEATRRQILADMGIPLWRLRVSVPQDGPVEVPQQAPEDAPVEARSRARTGADPAHSRSRSGANEAPVGRAPSDRDRSHSSTGRSPGRTEETPWSVLSLVLGDVVLLVDGASSRRDLRLAQDVLAAASGQWRGRPISRRFRWPPEVAGGSLPAAADAGGRALKAFLDKDVADHGARLLLCAEPVRQRLEEWSGCRSLTVPSLDALGRDPEAKRALWRAIEECRA